MNNEHPLNGKKIKQISFDVIIDPIGYSHKDFKVTSIIDLKNGRLLHCGGDTEDSVMVDIKDFVLEILRLGETQLHKKELHVVIDGIEYIRNDI